MGLALAGAKGRTRFSSALLGLAHTELRMPGVSQLGSGWAGGVPFGAFQFPPWTGGTVLD